jgi:hypothetical protein
MNQIRRAFLNALNESRQVILELLSDFRREFNDQATLTSAWKPGTIEPDAANNPMVVIDPRL